jgi:aminoglycoside phosphotransferase (APT) family kinase protein
VPTGAAGVGWPIVTGSDDFDNGWDTTATLVEGRWVDRTPRRPEVEPQVRREVALMPWLAPLLPLPVPVPRIVSQEPLTVRHALIIGEACPGTSAAHGRVVGAFLRALHSVDTDQAVRSGARDAETSCAEAQEIRDRMAVDVLPLLPRPERAAGVALLERMSVPPPDPRLVHGDLGPQHIRVVGDEVTGVIDWGDCGLGDPALDLAWTRYGAGPVFAAALETAYSPEADVLARGLDWHLLGPWHEVTYGLDTGQPSYVESGLAGAVRRLQESTR